MKKEEYRKYAERITPPPALEEETLALMREARDRGASSQKRPAPKLRFLPLAAGVAAVLAVTVITAAMVPKLFSRRMLSVNESAAEDFGIAEKNEKSTQTETAPNEAPETDGATAASRAPESEPSLRPNSSDSSGEMNGGASLSGSSEEELASTPRQNGPKSYSSLELFLNEVEFNSAPGYGENYYNKRALVIVPTSLPDYARFLGLELDPETGNYVYSYAIPYEGAEYLLTCTVTQDLPKTLAALEEALANVKTEAGDTWYQENAYVWAYGGDRLEAALTDAATGSPVEHEKMMKILQNFHAGRYELGNQIIYMKKQEN